MKNAAYKTWLMTIILATLAGCGGGGGGGNPFDPNAPASITMTASKPAALAGSRDTITFQAKVTRSDGAAVADGTGVAFSIDSTDGTMSASTAITANGLATVSLVHTAVTGSNRSVTVTATTGGVSGAKTVKFVKQPVSAAVSISFGNTVSNLGTLSFVLKNSTGGIFANASFDNGAQPISVLNAAAGSLAVGNFNSGDNAISLISATGFSTGTLPIIRVTYAISVGLELPVFSIDQFPSSFKATDSSNNPVVLPLLAGDLVVTTVYDTEL